MQQIDEIAKTKSLLLTPIKKDIKLSDELSVQAEEEKDFYFAYVRFFEKSSKTVMQGIKWLIWKREKFETQVTSRVVTYLYWHYYHEVLLNWYLSFLYKVDLFKFLFKVVSLIDFFVFISICMYILESLIVTWRQASAEKTLLKVLKEISLSDLLN